MMGAIAPTLVSCDRLRTDETLMLSEEDSLMITNIATNAQISYDWEFLSGEDVLDYMLNLSMVERLRTIQPEVILTVCKMLTSSGESLTIKNILELYDKHRDVLDNMYTPLEVQESYRKFEELPPPDTSKTNLANISKNDSILNALITKMREEQ